MLGGQGWGHCGIGASSLRPSVHIQSQGPRDETSRPLPWLRAASPVLLGGGWLPGPEPKAQRLGSLPSRSQEAGLAGEQRKDRWGEEEKVPGHPCGVPQIPAEPHPL